MRGTWINILQFLSIFELPRSIQTATRPMCGELYRHKHRSILSRVVVKEVDLRSGRDLAVQHVVNVKRDDTRSLPDVYHHVVRHVGSEVPASDSDTRRFASKVLELVR